MTVKEFYDATNGNYNETLMCLGKEERIMKYLLKFPAANNMALIKDALDKQDYETAFREAHNLKGMSINVGIKSLHAVSSDLTESLRNGPTPDVPACYEKTFAEYNRICELITQIS